MSNKELFKSLFGLPQDGFEEPIDLTDVELGFSLYKGGHKEGFKSLIRVYVESEELQKNGDIKQVVVTASYGKENERGITVSSSEFQRKRDWPIELIFEDEFFYNVKNHQLLDKKHKPVTGIEILGSVYKKHLKPTRSFVGLPLRLKLFIFHTLLASVFEGVFRFFAGLQYLISGDKVRIFHDFSNSKYKSVNYNETNNLHTTRGRHIKIFDYEVEIWIAILYSVIHLSIYGVLYYINFHPTWLENIFKNTFLTTLYTVLSMGAANVIFPIVFKPAKLFFPLLKFFQKAYLHSLAKRFKI